MVAAGQRLPPAREGADFQPVADANRAGGTVIERPPHPFFPAVGPGTLIPGLSDSLGFVNYTAYKLGDKDRLVLRSDILADFQGQRLGYKTTYFEHTLGWAHFFYDWLVFRPEIRFDYT